jgi:hypothetical protein
MKKLVLLILLCGVVPQIKSQTLEDFYEHQFGLFVPFSGMSTHSATMDSLGGASSLSYCGILNIDFTMASANRWGLAYMVKERQIGDMMFLLRGLLSKNYNKKPNPDFYLSDFGFLPNLRLGINVYTRDRTIINAGIAHNYYISEMMMYKNNQFGQWANDWLCFGPHVYVDHMLTDKIAVRFGTGPQFTYANGKKEKENVPVIWEHNLEVFTKFGLFAGLDWLSFTGVKDDLSSKMRFRRTDIKFGYRFTM